MDFTKAGLNESVIKFFKVFGYVALSGALLSVANLLAGYRVDPNNIAGIIALALINAIIAGLQKWLTTRAPEVDQTKEL